AAPVDGASVFTIQRDDVVGPTGRVLEVQVRKGLPTTAETDDLDVVLTAAIGHALDDCVEAGDVAAARENADAFSPQAHLPALACRNNAERAFSTRPLPACAPRADENASPVRRQCRGSRHTPTR